MESDGKAFPRRFLNLSHTTKRNMDDIPSDQSLCPVANRRNRCTMAAVFESKNPNVTSQLDKEKANEAYVLSNHGSSPDD